MKIKSITIQGFKSFVDRTRFVFPQGTSAIVGPNGCGKSNIVDAIRWVLGEQNARHLRGKLMEDLIFTGSDTRKPVGMAEVTLTLLNEDANAPARYANFPEIEIQRRLYRSGESEYLINKVQARLKDVVDLFTDTGIGTRAYSIIEQGQVGWLVTAKPEERRELFEEAAGINKFKIKKDAALRRLEATKTNLTRVADITSEVKRQLNSLNRQAKKAERYAVLKDELKDLELGLMHERYREMKGKLREKSTSLTALSDLETSCSAEVAKKEALSEEILSGHTTRDEEFKTARERSYEAEGRIREKERLEELSRLRVDELKRTAERLASDIEELKAEKGSTETEARALSAEVEETTLSLSREEGRVSEKEGSLDELNRGLESTQGELRVEEASSLETNSRLTEARHSIQGCLSEEDALLLTLGKAKTEREGIEKRLDENQGPLSELRGEVERAGDSKDSLASDFEEARKRLSSLEAESTVGEEKLKTFKEELAAKNSRLKTLEEMARNLEGVRGGAKAILRNGNGNGTDQNIHGIHGLIADVIEASPGCEKAVEAVLGERLECVVVESQREGVEAVEYLKTHASGRGSFVPITDPRHPERFNAEALGTGGETGESAPNAPNSPIDHRPAPEGTTRLINHVVVKSCYRPVVKQLLGGVLLVDNFQQALSIWMRNGISDTLVTPDGETIDPGGVITGGYSNGSDHGLLRKRREITELKELVATMEASYSTLSEETTESRTKTERLKTLTDGLTNKLHAMDIDRVQKANELKLHSDEEARLSERLGALSEEIRQGEERLSSLATKKLEVSRERETLEDKLTAATTRTSELSEKLQGLRRESGVLTEELTEMKVAFASAKQSFEHAKEKLRAKEAHGVELQRRIEAKTAEIEASKREGAGKEGEADSHRTELEGLLTEHDELKREVVLKEEALSELREDLDSVDAGLRILKKKFDGLHEERGSLGVELKGLELELENLRDKAVERYGVSIETYVLPEPSETGTEAGESLEPADNADNIEERVSELRERIGKMGEVSLSALEEFNELKGRHAFLEEQKQDLERSMESIRNAITRINRTTREKFKKTFEAINEEFKKNFPRFFSGGKAELRLSGEGDILEQGVEIAAQPPGKRLQNITLLSGGEKALTATALIFSIFLIKPSPFCLLDEVDAPLDDANIDRFNGFVRKMAEKSQFILITHNKRTMEMVDTLFGITMEEPGVSKSVSVQL